MKNKLYIYYTMAGGLFGQPFVLNIKCIIFAIICMMLFLYCPNFDNNYFYYFTLFLIFIVSYVAMAWYDYFFDCRILPLKRGEISLTGLFKPSTNEKNCKIDEKRNNMLIYWSHILIIVPILIYIIVKKNKVNKNIYGILTALATFTLFYHGSQIMISQHSQ